MFDALMGRDEQERHEDAYQPPDDWRDLCDDAAAPPMTPAQERAFWWRIAEAVDARRREAGRCGDGRIAFRCNW